MQSALSGNPTPPDTPNTQMPPSYPLHNGPACGPMPQGDVKPNMADLKPNIGRKDDELRLAFEIKDGVLLPPFRLEHNNSVNRQYFMIRDNIFQTLNYRCALLSSLPIQL